MHLSGNKRKVAKAKTKTINENHKKRYLKNIKA